MPQLTDEERKKFRAHMNEVEFLMDDDQRRFFLSNPDVLRALAKREFDKHFRVARVNLEPSPNRQSLPRALNDAWQLLDDGKVKISLLRWPVTVDYAIEPEDVVQASGIADDTLVQVEMEDRTERRNILRAGGSVTRLLRSIHFYKDVSFDMVRNVFALKQLENIPFRMVDPRTMVSYARAYGARLTQDQKFVATATSLMRGMPSSRHLRVPIIRKGDKNTLHFDYEDMMGMTAVEIFDTSFHFLVDVTPPPTPA